MQDLCSTDPTRQHELDHTDQESRSYVLSICTVVCGNHGHDHTDQESISYICGNHGHDTMSDVWNKSSVFSRQPSGFTACSYAEFYSTFPVLSMIR